MAGGVSSANEAHSQLHTRAYLEVVDPRSEGTLNASED